MSSLYLGSRYLVQTKIEVLRPALDTIHGQRVQLRQPNITVVFDIDPAAVAATRSQLLAMLAREDVLIAGPHISFSKIHNGCGSRNLRCTHRRNLPWMSDTFTERY
jgi:hypothetical protein